MPKSAKAKLRVEKSRPKSRLTGVAADPSLRGRGPAKGAPNAGRPPNEFKAYLSELVTRADVRKGVEDILTDPKMAYDPAKAKLYLDAFKWAAEHVHGKASQPVDASGSITVTFG